MVQWSMATALTRLPTLIICRRIAFLFGLQGSTTAESAGCNPWLVVVFSHTAARNTDNRPHVLYRVSTMDRHEK